MTSSPSAASSKRMPALLKTNLERARQQLAYKGISQADFDSAEASYKAAQAGVSQQQALIDKRQLRAPFSGRVGIVSLNPGSYVNSGDVVVTLQQVDPVFVDLNVPQDNLAEIKVGQTVVLSLRCVRRSSVPRRGDRDQPEARSGDPQRAGRGQRAERGPAAEARHVRQRGDPGRSSRRST